MKRKKIKTLAMFSASQQSPTQMVACLHLPIKQTPSGQTVPLTLCLLLIGQKGLSPVQSAASVQGLVLQGYPLGLKKTQIRYSKINININHTFNDLNNPSKVQFNRIIFLSFSSAPHTTHSPLYIP